VLVNVLGFKFCLYTDQGFCQYSLLQIGWLHSNISEINNRTWTVLSKLDLKIQFVMTVFIVARMVWTGDLPGVETLKENIAVYFNVLQGFLLACHGSTDGAGPTLHKFISLLLRRA
jgi:hypothetical protein